MLAKDRSAARRLAVERAELHGEARREVAADAWLLSWIRGLSFYKLWQSLTGPLPGRPSTN